MRIALFVVAFGLVAAEAHAIPPCFEPNTFGLSIPPDGSTDAPPNATPVVDGADLELRLVGPGGDEPFAVEQLIVGGANLTPATAARLLPENELSPGQTYTIIVDGQPRTTFTVGAAVDTEPPLPPEVGQEGDDGCSAAHLGIQSGGAAFFIGVVDGQPVLGANVNLNGLAPASSETLTVFGSGSAVVNVAGVDLAGNVSSSVPVEVEWPVPAGCSSTGAHVSAIGLLVLVGARSRSRSRSRFVSAG